MRASVLLGLLLLHACSGPCLRNSDCPAAMFCGDGICRLPPSDADMPDAVDVSIDGSLDALSMDAELTDGAAMDSAADATAMDGGVDADAPIDADSPEMPDADDLDGGVPSDEGMLDGAPLDAAMASDGDMPSDASVPDDGSMPSDSGASLDGEMPADGAAPPDGG
ncbi:MAG: hypothetical protein AAF411_16865 [Myxococcota bacterium]